MVEEAGRVQIKQPWGYCCNAIHSQGRVLCDPSDQNFKKITLGNFPSGAGVGILPSNAGGAVSIPGRGAEIPHASWSKNQNSK